ncbi:hypothetical protein [Leifsonia poae]|uniref:Uncharacterized protein n=1 Tax=Leifsonia poae TaxID=110933 RepID=A0A9W6HE30_9MICO|nr:hypothetical protein [Leifsonia poae]GLJ78083.1 hypothetical protein GCM10017584_36570 [Leifsonia poae]
MPWWSWIVIWVVLVLALLGMLAFFAVRLFRKLMAAAAEVSALADKAQILSQRAEELREAPFRAAVFQDAEELREAREQAIAERSVARQARRDARVRRGKLLVNADPTPYTYLTKRT